MDSFDDWWAGFQEEALAYGDDLTGLAEEAWNAAKQEDLETVRYQAREINRLDKEWQYEKAQHKHCLDSSNRFYRELVEVAKALGLSNYQSDLGDQVKERLRGLEK